MKCPLCGYNDTHVRDSRTSEDGSAIRRRRFCPNCDGRFTTFERIHVRNLIVIKRNGDRKPFNRDKITMSIMLAIRKRPITNSKVESMVNNIVHKIENLNDTEVPSSVIGQYVMRALFEVDMVAYIRFASVYMNFSDIEDFSKIVAKLVCDEQ